MSNQDKKWTISTDSSGQDFTWGEFYDTKEEAIVEFRKDLSSGGHQKVKDQGYFWVGQCLAHAAIEFFNADDICDLAFERANDEGGEYAEDYPDVTKEAKAELDDFLQKWTDKHGLEPNFYQIINSEKVTL